MKACEDRIPELVDAMEGNASPEFSAHLTTCVGCRTELEANRAITSLVERTRVVPDDLHLAGFAHRVTDAAERRRDGTFLGLWRRLAWKQRLSVGFGAAACAALGAVLVFLAGSAPGIFPNNSRTDPSLASDSRLAASSLQLLDREFDDWLTDADDFEADDFLEEEALDSLLVTWETEPVPSLEDGLGALSDEDIAELSNLLALASSFEGGAW